MMAFVISVIATFGGTGLVVLFARMRPKGTPLTWGEAMLAATLVFFLLFIAYGVMPHQWLTLADGPLKWRADAFFNPWLGLTGAKGINPIKGWGQILLTKKAVRDLIVVVIYGIDLVVHGWIWIFWQKRGSKVKVAPTSSSFGRPLVRPEA